MTVAQEIVKILEDRGVKYVFGLPGEENIALVNALNKSDQIQFILVQDERAGGFMAGMMGWMTGQPGVIIATLGPGALNTVLSIADAQTHSFPVIVIAAQGDLRDRVRETTQIVDLKAVFSPITKWSEDLVMAESTTQIINKAFNVALADRKGASFVTIPVSLEQELLDSPAQTVINSPNPVTVATEEEFLEASELIKKAKNPVILAGLGTSRDPVSGEVRRFSEDHQIPLMTSFMAKGIIPETSELSLGVAGFFVDDYLDTYLEEVDLILAIGYDFAEFDPTEINPHKNKKIVNLHTFTQETHENFSIDSQIIGDLAENITRLSETLGEYHANPRENSVGSQLANELAEGSRETPPTGPLKPAQIVHATREALPKDGKVLVDTGAVKMWMARLFPAEDINTVLINNALSTMSWALPGTISAKLLYPKIPMLTVVGDGAFYMSQSEIATAIKYDIPLTILIWDDSGYGLIKWKMKMDLDEHAEVDFINPDFKKIAEAYGGNGFVVNSRDELEKTLKECLTKDEGINIIVAPVDYSENMKLTEELAEDN